VPVQCKLGPIVGVCYCLVVFLVYDCVFLVGVMVTISPRLVVALPLVLGESFGIRECGYWQC
jgi:hypothetical protein